MTRSILCGLMALLSVGALGLLPVACQSGGIGDPCTPEDEYNTQFPGFKIEQENIESRSFQCQTRICLVNHFQGRASCPAGQGSLKNCKPSNNGSECAPDQKCIQSETYAPTCTTCDGSDPTCVPTSCPAGLTCDATRNICTCGTGQQLNGVDFACEPADPSCTGAGCPQVLNSYVCHKPGNCQTGDPIKGPPPGSCQADADCGSTNYACTGGKCVAKDCCVPGTDHPVAVSVCGQCDSTSKRNADQAVYCSGRCCAPCCPAGTADDDAADLGCSNDKSICGPACDPNFNYWTCPSGYTCAGIRQDVGLGDKQLAGAYCIKSGTGVKTTSKANCGAASQGGYVGDNSCAP
jgi:hypothetical protein